MIAEGSTKLASVPSGGAGGAAAGGAAAASGGAAAAEEKAEEKEEGMNHNHQPPCRFLILTCDCREGRVRRGHGLRSLRLSASYHYLPRTTKPGLQRWKERQSPYCLEESRRRAIGRIKCDGSLIEVMRDVQLDGTLRGCSIGQSKSHLQARILIPVHRIAQRRYEWSWHSFFVS